MRLQTKSATTPAIREQAHYWRDPQMPGIELLTATFVTHTFARHTHDTYVFAVIEEGAEAFSYNRAGKYVAGEGSIGVIDPGVVHTGFAEPFRGNRERWWRYRVFYPEISVVTELARLAGWRGEDYPVFPSVVYSDPVFFERMQRLHILLEGGDLSRLEQDTRLVLTLGAFAARVAVSAGTSNLPRRGTEKRATDKAREYLETHPTENVSLETLSQVAGVSPFHLVRVFKQAWGIPPHEFQTLRRVDIARRLLLAGQSASEVASVAGFVDQSHLTRHFRRVVGVTPGRFMMRR